MQLTFDPETAVLRAEVTTAAVCVYPARVADAVSALKAANASLPVASGKTPGRIQFSAGTKQAVNRFSLQWLLVFQPARRH